MKLADARSRRRLPLLLAPALAVAGLTGFGDVAVTEPAAALAQAQAPAEQPNVLLIVTDDQRRSTMDVLPTVRHYFERNGVDYDNAFATSPLCCPSRASIMTGRYPHNHDVRRNEDAEKLVQESTIQYYLQQAGYTTAITGKYLNSWKEAAHAPPYFDRWATIDDTNYGKVYVDFLANVNGDVFNPPGYSTTFVEDNSVRFLRRFEKEDRTPWFLYVSPFAAHKPFTPEWRYRNKTTRKWFGSPATGEEDRSDKPQWVQRRFVTVGDARPIARKQRRALMSVDDMVARLFRVLGRLNEKRDTLAFFISDNGYMWGEHGVASKRFPYTPAVRVPLFMRWPGEVDPGRQDQIVGNIDLAPTILEAAGITPNPEYPIDGRSLLQNSARKEILFEYSGSRLGKDVPPWASLRGPDYQYIEYYEESTGDVLFAEYYDLKADPFQLVNLLSDGDPSNDPPAAALSAQLRQARDCSGAACP